MARLCVIIPAFNEEAGIFSAVKAVEAALSPYEILVVDDGSRDGTAGEARRAGARVIGQSNRGHGAALLAGMAAAQGEWLFLCDADDEIDLSKAGAHFARALAEDSPLFGVRLGRKQSPLRALASWGLARKAGVPDPNAPYKFLSKRHLAEAALPADLHLPSLALARRFKGAIRVEVAVKKARKGRISLARLFSLARAALREMRDYS